MSLFGPPNVEKLRAKRDLKGLLLALTSQSYPDARRAAREALTADVDLLVTGYLENNDAMEAQMRTTKAPASHKRVVLHGLMKDALAEIGPPAVPALLEAVRAAGGRNLTVIGEVLRKMANCDNALTCALDDPDEHVGAAAADALRAVAARRDT